MLKVHTLFSLCEKQMPQVFSEIMTSIRPPHSGYAEKIDRRLSVTYPVFLDSLGLIAGSHPEELLVYESFMLRYTDEDVDLIRSACNRLEQVRRIAGLPHASGEADETSIWSELTVSEERLKYYSGWCVPNLGVAGQHINLLPLYKTFGSEFCTEVHQAIIDYVSGIDPKTVKFKIDALLVVNRILAEIFSSKAELKDGFEGKLNLVLERHWSYYHCEHFNRRSESQFYEAMRLINDLYMGYGFIKVLSFPLSGRTAKIFLRDSIKGKRFS